MQYELMDNVAVLTFDDKKANAVGHAFIDGMMDGLNRAEKEAAAVVISGREGVFSAGFDLKEFQKGAEETAALVGRGMAMLTRLYAHPQPVLAACAGHAIGAGAFILLAADTRIGVNDDFKVHLPETALGMPFTATLQELIFARLAKRHQTRAMIQSVVYTPSNAVEAGFLDELVEIESLQEHTLAFAKELAKLPAHAYGQNKHTCRAASLAKMRSDLA